MIIHDDFTNNLGVYLLKKCDTSRQFEHFLADVRNQGEIESVRSHNGSEFIGYQFVNVSNCHRIGRE